MSHPSYQLVRPAPVVSTPPVLDLAQQRVVSHPGGPLLVLAGPGTGKTTTLVEAVADRILNRGVAVEQILVLTFGQRAAGELRDRITARLNLTVREPLARTFHSYAFAVLRMAADDELPPPRLLSGTEQDIMLRELIAGDLEARRSPWPPGLEAALVTHGFAAELRDLLLRAAERGVDADQLGALGERYQRPDWQAAAIFMRQYAGVTAFARPGAYDAAELIQGAIGALDNDRDLLARERGRRRHIFVDEYQDTDPAQIELLSLISAGAEELVLVGDPDQSIYAFRGADPGAIRRAGDVFAPNGQLPTVALTTSRRSGAELLSATRRLASRLPAPFAHRALVPAAGLDPGQISVTILRSATEEAATIAGRLRRAHLEQGVPWGQMAVIVRSTAHSLAVLRRAMITAGVPTASSGPDVPLAEQTAVSQLLTALEAVVHPERITDELAEALLLGAIGDADAIYLRRLRRELHRLARAAGENAPDDVIAPWLRDPTGATVLPPALHGPLARVSNVLAAGATALAAGASAEDVLWATWQASGLAPVWERRSARGGQLGAAADRDLDAVIDLFAAAARLADRLPGATAEALFDHVLAQQVHGDAWSSPTALGNGVQILTAHASKGLEWDVVCIAAAQEGSWPDLRRRGSVLGSEFLVDVVGQRAEVADQSLQPILEEERRLFYVAATRARRQLFVTAVTGDDEQPSRFLDELDPIDGDRPVHIPSRGLHLSDLVADLRRAVTDPNRSDEVRSEAAGMLARLAQARVPGADPDQWWGLAELSDERGLIDDDVLARVSPSQIDSFVTCALRTMLDGAGAKEESTAKAALGSAIHEIAELADAAADLEQLEAMMTERWPGLDFGAPWYSRAQRKKATVMLERLSDWLLTSRHELDLVGKELDFSVEVDGARLGGKVDRVERDHEGRLVVIDFKTGGTAADGKTLEEHPQLGAYQLAVTLGGFEQFGSASGGARLVQLGTGRKQVEQNQTAFANDADAEWIRALIGDVVTLQRGLRFDAKVNQYCQMCSVKRLCPAQDGRQVTA